MKRSWKAFDEKDDSVSVSCAAPGCTGSGLHPAPKNRDHACRKNPDHWHWFCLEHVRLYNAEWNYYKNMSAEEVENDWRHNLGWQRPTWPIGQWATTTFGRFRKAFAAQDAKQSSYNCKDPFGLFGDEATSSPIKRKQTEEEKLLELFQLSFPFTQDDLQRAYRLLVKQYHPDLHPNKADAEENLKRINASYATLKKLIQG